MTKPFDGVSRRGLVAAGAALSAGAVTTMPGEAKAAGPSALNGPPASQASPITNTIASPRRDYVVYRTIGEFDISVESDTAHRRFGGRGVYSVGAQTSLWASIDIPGGVKIKDVEFYATNNTGSILYGGVWLWTANDGYFSYQLATAPVAASPAQQAVLADISSDNNGPYPSGTKLFLTMFTPTTGTLQWNGARVGMVGGGEVSLRRSPVRAYDSRTESKFEAKQTRAVTLGASVAPEGTVGVLAQISVLSPSSSGYIQVWSAKEDRPDVGELRHSASASVFSVTFPLPVTRKFKIYSHTAAHIVVDVIGTIG